MIEINFSWDDGAIEDMKLMDLSLNYNIPSIFFIPVKNPERSVMHLDDIRKIDKNNFEIGAHTYSHSYLTTVSLKTAEEELINGKMYLEDLLGKKILHFCFPGGRYNQNLINISKRYYKSVRTADTCSFIGQDPFIIKPTFHFFDRGKKSLLYNAMKNNSLILKLTLRNILIPNYFNLIKELLVELSNSSEVFRINIWGHSWELEEFKLWKTLEDFFQFINFNFQKIEKITYSDLVNKIQKEKA